MVSLVFLNNISSAFYITVVIHPPDSKEERQAIRVTNGDDEVDEVPQRDQLPR